MADYRRSLTDMTPEELQQVAPGFAPASEVSKPLSVQGAELAVSTLTPLDFAVEVQEELKKDDPDYLYIGAMAGVEVIGALPGLGSAAKNMIRQGAKFKTKRGSIYTVEDQSRTTRERAPDTPGGEFVKQPTSGKTVYMSYEDMERFGPLFQKGEPELYQFVPTGKDKAQLVFTQDYGPYKAGDAVPNTEVSYTLEPQLGLNPVEIYDSTNKNKRSIHFGNEIVEVESDIPKVSRNKDITPQMSNDEYDMRMAALDEIDDVKEWQQAAKKEIETGRVVDPQIKTPELEESTRLLLDNKITREEHLANVDKFKPVNAWDALPREPSNKAVVYSLKDDQRLNGFFVLDNAAEMGVNQSSLKVGDLFNGRLDIPAYNSYDTWIVTGSSKDAEKGKHYLKAVHYRSSEDAPVKFIASTKTSEKIGAGEMNKTPYATVQGFIEDLDADAIRAKAAEYLNDPEWTQIGFDPRRQGGFYVRAGENKHVPIREASEVIQIGPLLLAKNAKLDMEYSGYNEGGTVMDEQMKAVFKSNRTGYAVGGSVDLDSVPDNNVDVDPVSGNPVPLGSSPEEVRDDIPAQLSEGEYVVPADVVRYYGVKFFEDLRADAKFGYQDMQENGRIGGEPIGMEMGQDELPFDVSELQVSDDDMPEQAFLGKLFGKKEKSPEETVRERFKAAEGRDNSARAIAERRAAAIAREMAEKEDNSGSSGASIDLGFSGNPMERAERKYGNKSKPKSNPSGAGSVTGAYTPGGGGETFAERINFGGNYNEGGDVAEQTESLFPDDFNMYGGSGVVYIKYTNGERIIEIPFFNGIPMAIIPEGFYPLGEDVPPEDTEEEEAVEATSDDGGSTPDVPMPDPIDYANLTADELAEMVEQQTTFGMDDGVSALLGALNPLAGLFMKGAMMHQAKLTKNELERRVKLEGISDEERARYQSLIEITEQPNFMQGILGKIKGTFEKKPEAPEIPTIDKQSVTDAVTEAMAYDPTARAATEESEITVSELAPIVQPNNKSGEMPKVEPKDPTPFTGTAAYMGYGSEKGNTLGQGDSPTPITDAFGTGNIFTSGKQPKTTPGIDSQADKQNVREQATISDRQRKQAGMGIDRESTNKVIYDAAEKGASAQDLKNMAKEAEKVAAALESTSKGGKMGFKKGGLASKKKK